MVTLTPNIDPAVAEAHERLRIYGINRFNSSRLAQLFLALDNPYSDSRFNLPMEDKDQIRADIMQIMGAKKAADLRTELKLASDELQDLCYQLSGKKRRKKNTVKNRKYKVVTTLDVPFIENEILCDILLTHAPHRPYCCDEFSSNSPRDLDVALTKRYVQLNPPGYSSFIVIDVDRPSAAIAWQGAGLPTPTWTSTNPANGHAHLVYALKVPIWRDGDNKKPMRYVDAIKEAYLFKLNGDPDYANLLSKNPSHPDWITTSECHFKLYELGELAKYVELVSVVPKNRKVKQEALGRNSLVFNTVSQWAYRAVKLYDNRQTFGYAVIDQVEKMNATLPELLCGAETRSIAKSITKWVWKNIGCTHGTTSLALSERQAALGRRSGEVRRAKSNRLASAMAAAVSNLSAIKSQQVNIGQ